MQPGLRRIAPGQAQLTPSRPNGRHLREKVAVLATTTDEALLAVPGFDAVPALQAIAREAAPETPPAFEFESPDDCAAPHLGWALRAGRPEGDGEAAIGDLLAALPAARRATALLCLAFEEDFAIIDGVTATIPWLAVCLPSRWAPEEKIGRHFAEVHAPVADNSLLIEASDRLAHLVTGSVRWERRLTILSIRAAQHRVAARSTGPEARTPGSRSPACAMSIRPSFRFRARPAVFTIRVASEPPMRLRSRDDATRLHDALASMSASVLLPR